MGLKQDIVIRNEFTVKYADGRKDKKGRKGTRGGTPGDYITQYMARELATEPLAPIRRRNVDTFITRYMARESATERLDIRTKEELKQAMADAQGAGGLAFGYGQVSLSHEQLHAASRDIQRLFDAGHTVMKTVLSFQHDFLRKHGIIRKGFVATKRGDYRGQIDQMKLRLAVMFMLGRLGRSLYDDLRHVSVIQVDTENVHVHIAMVDAGKGTVVKNGTQNGRLNARAKSIIRRSIDSWLDRKQTVRHLASAVGYERRNVVTFVKKWAHQQMLRESLPQFLLACLPEDRRLWRASTNNAAMRKPNHIVHQLVEEVLNREGSPMAQAMAEVHNYANHRRDAEGLSNQEWHTLVDNGRAQIIERSVNAVYGLLKQLPKEALTVRTPMLDVMSLDLEQVAKAKSDKPAEVDLVGFSYRLRSYSKRLEHHVQQRDHYHQQVRTWETLNARGETSADSRALYAFWVEEERYQAMCAAKYRHFLNFIPPSTEWYREWNEVAEYGERLRSLEAMVGDQTLKRLQDPDEAERMGREIYGQPGGRDVAGGDETAKRILATRIDRMRRTYEEKVEDLKVSLAGKGLQLEVERATDGTASKAKVTPGAEYPFPEVKGMDLHHMRFDFSKDVEIGQAVFDRYLRATRRRHDKLEAAVKYLVASGQPEAVSELPVKDVREMVRMAADIARGSQTLLPSHVAELVREREVAKRSRTVELGANLRAQLVHEIESVTSQSSLGYEQEMG